MSMALPYLPIFRDPLMAIEGYKRYNMVEYGEGKACTNLQADTLSGQKRQARFHVDIARC